MIARNETIGGESEKLSDNIIRPSSLISIPGIPINSICGEIIVSWNETLAPIAILIDSFLCHPLRSCCLEPLFAVSHCHFFPAMKSMVEFVWATEMALFAVSLPCLSTTNLELCCKQDNSDLLARSLFAPSSLVAIYKPQIATVDSQQRQLLSSFLLAHNKTGWSGIFFKSSAAEVGPVQRYTWSDMHWYVINSDQFAHSFFRLFVCCQSEPNVYFPLSSLGENARRMTILLLTNTEEEETWIPATVPGEEKRRSREQRDSDGRWAAFQTMIAQNFFLLGWWSSRTKNKRTLGLPNHQILLAIRNATSHSISCLQRPPTTQSSSPYHFDSREIFFFLLAILLVLSHCQGTLLKGNSRIRTLTQREKWINIDLVN